MRFIEGWDGLRRRCIYLHACIGTVVISDVRSDRQDHQYTRYEI